MATRYWHDPEGLTTQNKMTRRSLSRVTSRAELVLKEHMFGVEDHNIDELLWATRQFWKK